MRALVEKLDRRLAKDPEISGRVTLKHASPETREAVTSLLGLPPKPTGPLRVDLRRLDDAIRESGAADGLIPALAELLGRPPQHPAIEKEKAQKRWHSAWQTVADGETSVTDTALAYTQEICASGVLRRAARGSIENATILLHDLARCLAALPRTDPTPLPIFATSVLGDSHALDLDRPLNSLLLQAIARTQRLEQSGGSSRDVWSSVGVVQDEYSSTVLVLNLSARDEGLLGRMLAAHAAVGEPCRLTFAQLRRHRLILDPNTPSIFICENPSIVAAAAEQLKHRSQPLICVEGQPSHAAASLLAACRESGVRLRYHGDIDRSGLQIAAQIMERFGAEPWRLSAADYERQARQSAMRWKGAIPATPWDARLATAIDRHQKVILEETVVQSLLEDLGSSE